MYGTLVIGLMPTELQWLMADVNSLKIKTKILKTEPRSS
jgi:hypothetical protein